MADDKGDELLALANQLGRAVSDDEAERLILSALSTSSHSEVELQSLLDYAKGIKLQQSMIDNILRGLMDWNWDKDTKEPRFRLNAAGKRYVEAMLRAARERN